MEAICNVDYDKRVKAKDASDTEAKRNPTVKVMQVGFHDIYGVWFFGTLCGVIRQVCLSRFDVDLEKMMHVFVDTEPGNILDGIHDLTVYGRRCRLYKWTAQGYHRGLVVLSDDAWGCAAAQVYLESNTRSWLLNEEDKVKLSTATNGD